MAEPPSSSAPAEHIREYVAGIVARAMVHGQHAFDYAQLGDDRGLTRSLRLMSACVVNAAETLILLANRAEADARLREAVRAVYGPQPGAEPARG